MVNDDKENVHRTPVFRGTPYPATREVLSTIVNNVNRFQEYVMKEKTYVEVGKIVEYLYVDRVVNGKRQVRRKKPTFVGWSDSLILDRQISELATGSLKTFFNGRVALPLRSKHSDDESSYEDNTWNIVSAASSDDDEVQCDRNDEHGSFNSVPNVSQAGKDLNQFEILTDGKLSEAHYEKDVGDILTGNFIQSIGEQKILGKKYLYVDRVVNGKRQVRRKKPTFVGWSDSLILDRQISELATGSLKTFFNGRVALPLRSKHSDDESSYEDNTWNIVSAASSDDDEVQCDRNDEHGSFNSVPNVSQGGKDLNQFEILTDGKLSEAHYEKDVGVTLTGNFAQSPRRLFCYTETTEKSSKIKSQISPESVIF
uniref:Uncharacterized protein n=1 Tax=Daucus carota subsp. sativus TaxID=79200 RepID=A0A164TLX8_DAUCS